MTDLGVHHADPGVHDGVILVFTMARYPQLLADPDNSDEEDRFILLGLSTTRRLLVVCHCSRRRDESIRIISTRKATQLEAAVYADRWGQ